MGSLHSREARPYALVGHNWVPEGYGDAQPLITEAFRETLEKMRTMASNLELSALLF